MNIKRRLQGVMAAVMAGLMMVSAAGCAGNDGGTIATDGSASMEKVIGLLQEPFEAAYDGDTVTYNPTGPGTGKSASSGVQ